MAEKKKNKKITSKKKEVSKVHEKDEQKPDDANDAEKKIPQVKLEVILICIAGISLFMMISIYLNGGGSLGTRLAKVLKGLFGIGSFLLPITFILGCIGVLFSDSKKINVYKLAMGAALFIFIISFVHLLDPVNGAGISDISAYLKAVYENGGFSNGGLVGAVIGDLLTKLLSHAGAFLVLVFGSACMFVLITEKSLFKILKNIYNTFSKYLSFEKPEYSDEEEYYYEDAEIDDEDDFQYDIDIKEEIKREIKEELKAEIKEENSKKNEDKIVINTYGGVKKQDEIKADEDRSSAKENKDEDDKKEDLQEKAAKTAKAICDFVGGNAKKIGSKIKTFFVWIAKIIKESSEKKKIRKNIEKKVSETEIEKVEKVKSPTFEETKNESVQPEKNLKSEKGVSIFLEDAEKEKADFDINSMDTSQKTVPHFIGETNRVKTNVDGSYLIGKQDKYSQNNEMGVFAEEKSPFIDLKPNDAAQDKSKNEIKMKKAVKAMYSGMNESAPRTVEEAQQAGLYNVTKIYQHKMEQALQSDAGEIGDEPYSNTNEMQSYNEQTVPDKSVQTGSESENTYNVQTEMKNRQRKSVKVGFNDESIEEPQNVKRTVRKSVKVGFSDDDTVQPENMQAGAAVQPPMPVVTNGVVYDNSQVVQKNNENRSIPVKSNTAVNAKQYKKPQQRRINEKPPVNYAKFGMGNVDDEIIAAASDSYEPAATESKPKNEEILLKPVPKTEENKNDSVKNDEITSKEKAESRDHSLKTESKPFESNNVNEDINMTQNVKSEDDFTVSDYSYIPIGDPFATGTPHHNINENVIDERFFAEDGLIENEEDDTQEFIDEVDKLMSDTISDNDNNHISEYRINTFSIKGKVTYHSADIGESMVNISKTVEDGYFQLKNEPEKFDFNDEITIPSVTDEITVERNTSEYDDITGVTAYGVNYGMPYDDFEILFGKVDAENDLEDRIEEDQEKSEFSSVEYEPYYISEEMEYDRTDEAANIAENFIYNAQLESKSGYNSEGIKEDVYYDENMAAADYYAENALGNLYYSEDVSKTDELTQYYKEMPNTEYLFGDEHYEEVPETEYLSEDGHYEEVPETEYLSGDEYYEKEPETEYLLEDEYYEEEPETEYLSGDEYFTEDTAAYYEEEVPETKEQYDGENSADGEYKPKYGDSFLDYDAEDYEENIDGDYSESMNADENEVKNDDANMQESDDLPPFDPDPAPTVRNNSKYVPIEIIKPEEIKPAEIKIDMRNYDYKFPKLEFLKENPNLHSSSGEMELRENAEKLISVLKTFKIDAQVQTISQGPTVTRYEITVAEGTKLSKISDLSDNIAYSLEAISVRIEAPIPGKSAVGIEIPNKVVKSVYLSEVIGSQKFYDFKEKTIFGIGKDITGNVIIEDISAMPHLLIAGATGAGKSVCINTLIMSIIYKSSPKDVRLIMVDPKVVELAAYEDIPHLLIPVVTDPEKASSALNWVVAEMMERYSAFKITKTKNIAGYNEIADKNNMDRMAHIVVVIDELADLMMVAKKEVESSICRIAQLARAAGIHLVIATQRPSTDVITGLIKANIPSRIAFKTSNGIDSTTILDQRGAEKLIGRGDMLLKTVKMGKPLRIQCAFISEEEIEKVVDYVKENNPCVYDQSVIDAIDSGDYSGDSDNGSGGGGKNSDRSDELLEEVIAFLVKKGEASTSMVQRAFHIGYNRAANIIEELEEMGIVGSENGSKRRFVLMDQYQYEEWITRRNSY